MLALAATFGVQTDYLLDDAIPTEQAEHYRIALDAQQGALPTRFGDKLRWLRKARGLTQMDVTAQLQLGSQTFVSRLEAGKHYLHSCTGCFYSL